MMQLLVRQECVITGETCSIPAKKKVIVVQENSAKNSQDRITQVNAEENIMKEVLVIAMLNAGRFVVKQRAVALKTVFLNSEIALQTFMKE